MANELSIEWNPAQKSFISTPRRYAAFVGAMGCGKTAAACRRGVAIAMKYPGSTGIMARFHFNEVEDILAPQFLDIVPDGLRHKWRRSDGGELEIYAGTDEHGAFVGSGISRVLFRNLEDTSKYRSHNLRWFGISQADDAGITDHTWTELVGRLREGGKRAKQYGFLESNYHGHNWVWRWFHPEGQARSGKFNDSNFNPQDYFLVEGKTKDNEKHLPDAYLASLEAMPEDWKKRHFYGSWDELGGIIYEEFNLTNHQSPGFWVNGEWQRTAPKWWKRYRAIDHGIRNPTCCLWATTSPGGTVYIYDEYYETGGVVRDHARAIRDRHPDERYIWTMLPHDAFARDATSGESPSEHYFKEGVNANRTPQQELWPGIAVVKRYMKDKDEETGRPKLQIVSGRAPNLVSQIHEYVWDELSPSRRDKRNEPERPRKVNDHAVDALRYLLISRPTPSPEVEPKKITDREKIAAYGEHWEV